MNHLMIGQVFRYKMATKMAAKIVYLNESNPKYIPVVYVLHSRSQKWEIKSYTALNIMKLHINLMYPLMTNKGRSSYFKKHLCYFSILYN